MKNATHRANGFLFNTLTDGAHPLRNRALRRITAEIGKDEWGNEIGLYEILTETEDLIEIIMMGKECSWAQAVGMVQTYFRAINVLTDQQLAKFKLTGEEMISMFHHTEVNSLN